MEDTFIKIEAINLTCYKTDSTVILLPMTDSQVSVNAIPCVTKPVTLPTIIRVSCHYKRDRGYFRIIPQRGEVLARDMAFVLLLKPRIGQLLYNMTVPAIYFSADSIDLEMAFSIAMAMSICAK